MTEQSVRRFCVPEAHIKDTNAELHVFRDAFRDFGVRIELSGRDAAVLEKVPEEKITG